MEQDLLVLKKANHTEEDIKCLTQIIALNPKLKPIFAEKRYSPWDAKGVDRLTGETVFYFEIKIRRPKSVPYIKREQTLFIDYPKYEKLIKLDKPSIICQVIPDSNLTTYIFKLDPEKVTIKTKNAKKNTNWGGQRTDKQIAEYKLSDCYKCQLQPNLDLN